MKGGGTGYHGHNNLGGIFSLGPCVDALRLLRGRLTPEPSFLLALETGGVGKKGREARKVGLGEMGGGC